MKWIRCATVILIFAAACGGDPVRAAHPASASPTSPQLLTPRRVAIDDPECDRIHMPPPSGPGALPLETFTKIALPVVHAVCACTRADESTHLSATFSPEEGTVIAHAGTPSIDDCIQSAIGSSGIGRYPPIEYASDCIGCEPDRHATLTYGIVFAHPKAAE